MFSKILKLAGLFSVCAAILLFSNIKPVSASALENVRGWANNSTYGYISFNCLDDGYAGHFTLTFPFVFNVPPCAYNQHGVNLDANNNFSGDAWNSVLGFITFSSASSTPDDTFRSHCSSCVSGTCSACYEENSRQVFGYMQVKTTGEWIKLDGLAIPTQITNYLDPQPGIFSGYATSSFGAISFNCANDGSCATNNYLVKIGPLEIRQMIAPNWGNTEACSLGANQAILKWNRRSGTQTGYQVIVSTANSTSTGVVYNSGQISNTATQASVSSLAYDTPYYWFLKLWDDTGTSTAWRQFNTSGTKDWISDNYARNLQIGNAKTFTTYKHEFPRPLFTWSPTEITIATTSNSFLSNSSYYNDSNTPQSCSIGLCALTWSTSDPGATILSTTTASTSIIFLKATSTTVTLTSTDNDIYTCSTSTVLNVNYALPLWKEVKATSTH